MSARHMPNHKSWSVDPTRTAYRVLSDEGYLLSAGGILIYDSTGVWLVGERARRSDKTLKYTDPGGRYRFEDCHIYTTVARELNEELYNSVQLVGRHVHYFSSLEPPIYLDNKIGKPTYACFPVTVKVFESTGNTISIDTFNSAREYTLERNSRVPKHLYTTQELRKFSYSELATELKLAGSESKLSSRVRDILRRSKLAIYDKSTEAHV